MTGRLLETYKQKIARLELEPSGGGCFEVSLDGELVYSKLATGEFPDEAALTDMVGQRLSRGAKSKSRR